MIFKVNIFKVDLSVFTPACLPGTGNSFVGRTAVAYGIFRRKATSTDYFVRLLWLLRRNFKNAFFLHCRYFSWTLMQNPIFHPTDIRARRIMQFAWRKKNIFLEHLIQLNIFIERRVKHTYLYFKVGVELQKVEHSQIFSRWMITKIHTIFFLLTSAKCIVGKYLLKYEYQRKKNMNKNFTSIASI